MTLTSEQKSTVMRALKSSGLFISCGKENPNLMSTHWGAFGSFWNKEIFILPVRPGKLSYETIEKTKSFAVSVPVTDMRNEIIRCDHMSGYTVNKFEALQLHPKRTRKIDTYSLRECGLILECKVIFSASAENAYVDPALDADMYANKAYHTMYFGEIVDCYSNRN